ncbi:hypothetical protein [Amycolatopsis sp. lyj-109]|uniref:hypothetical protein n=1 Tax=Amycolatopsis sp. lyj-109 TaxID=2789287 RepID=UPI00397AE193
MGDTQVILPDSRRGHLFRERGDTFRADLRVDVEAGVIDPGLRPDDVAVAIAGQLRGIALQPLVGRSPGCHR